MAVVQERREGKSGTGLLDRIAGDPAFARIREEIAEMANPARFIGRAPDQVEEFFREEVQPVLGDGGQEETWEVKV